MTPLPATCASCGQRVYLILSPCYWSDTPYPRLANRNGSGHIVHRCPVDKSK